MTDIMSACTPDAKPKQGACCTNAFTASVCADLDSGSGGIVSPVCPLTQAVQALSAATSGNSSTDDSGVSVAAPSTAVVDSIAAVAALRRGHLRYRSAFAAGSAPRRTQLYLKLPGADPDDLQPGFIGTVNESLRAHGSGLRVVGAYVRRGCIELTLDLLDKGTGSAAFAAGQSDQLDIPALILSALGTPPPPLDDGADANGGDGTAATAAGRTVLVQRGDACWALQWDADAMQWQLCEQTDGGDFGGAAIADDIDAAADDGGAAVSLSASAAVHAPAHLQVGAEPLRLAVLVHGDVDFSAGGGAAASAAPTLIAKANGRTAVAPVVSVRRCSRGGGAATCTTSVQIVQVDVDVAALAAGRLASSAGLVVRLELWRAGRCAGRCLTAVLRAEELVAELEGLERDIAAAGELDPQDDAYLSPEAQREEVEQLLADLSGWLDYVAAAAADVTTAAAAGGAADPDRRDSLDLSSQVSQLLQRPDMQHTLLSAGQHLLEHFVYHGHAALARSVYGDLARLTARAGGAAAATFAAALHAPRGDAPAGPGPAPAPTAAGQRKTLLHRAVRSGSRAMVEQVLHWMYDGTALTGNGCTAIAAAGGAAGVAAWGARGPGGVTPLHLLAADARCSGAAAALAAGGAAAEAAAAAAAADPEALLRWIIGTFPAAVTVWNTARDASGNTPARLWSALGGPDIQLQAAAAALEDTVVRLAAEPQPEAAPVAGPSSSAAPNACTAAPTKGASSSSPFSSPAVVPASTAGADAEASLLGGPRPGLRGLAALCVTGFPTPSMEARYVDYVTHTTAASTAIWVVIMVLAHVTAFSKSLSSGDSQQAVIGGAAYCASLALMVLRPSLYVALRERLMLSCLLGRTLCRLLMSVVPDMFHMNDSVSKYITYGLDILLDGLLEGTFEQARFTRAAMGRLIEAPVTTAFMFGHGLRPSYGSALLRAAAVSGAGLAMSGLMDLRLRASFLAAARRRNDGTRAGAGGAAAAVGKSKAE